MTNLDIHHIQNYGLSNHSRGDNLREKKNMVLVIKTSLKKHFASF